MFPIILSSLLKSEEKSKFLYPLKLLFSLFLIIVVSGFFFAGKFTSMVRGLVSGADAQTNCWTSTTSTTSTTSGTTGCTTGCTTDSGTTCDCADEAVSGASMACSGSTTSCTSTTWG